MPPTGGSIVKMALAGGTPMTLLSASTSFSGLVADEAHLYCPQGRAILSFAASDGTVIALPTDGTPAVLAVDETRIYFGTTEGALMAMAKP